MATNYSGLVYYGDSCTLDMLRTKASNIKLINLRNVGSGATQKLSDTSYAGINGGFFNSSTDLALLNIALQDGAPVGPASSDGANNYVGTGVIGWDGNEICSNNYASSSNNVSFANSAGTWAQGGIALWLGYNLWENKVQAQAGASDYLSGEARRSALVGDVSTNNIYMITTTYPVSFADFRATIQDYFNISDGSTANTRYKGIMLDGGRSAQLKYGNTNIPAISLGLSRKLAQIITLKATT